MGDETVTRTDHQTSAELEGGAQVPVLTIVEHRDPAFVGTRHLLRDEESVVLGRNTKCFGRGALDESRVSRKHLEVSRSGARVSARDLGSRNGSFVNGEPFSAGELSFGDVIALGRVLLLFHRGPVFHEPSQHSQLVGVSPAISGVVGQLEKVGPHSVSVLIQGESGVGKELVASCLHGASGRAGAFVPVNCGGLAEGVVQSELFGHVRGAFSGAGNARRGLVESARGGTLFLDEIADAPPALQTSLLRLLESGDYRPVGSDQLLHADVRFLAATHVSLARAVAEGRFREDLFSRLNRYVIDVPPLRDRPEDILPLAHAFAERASGERVVISRPLAVALLRHPWPQNVRELAAVIEQALIERGDRESLRLTPTLLARLVGESTTREQRHREPPTRDELLARLARHGGNVKALATELGIARTTLYRWLRAAEIDPNSVR
jgi:DNA-binding NtrC family response regulator